MKRLRFSAAAAALMLFAPPVFAAEQPLYSLRDWLLAKPDTAMAAPAEADRNRDGVLDACDLTRMKRDALIPAQPEQTIDVSDIAGIFTAMRSAKPGDVIRIAPGTYDYTVYQGADKIDTKAAGTAEGRINSGTREFPGS